jgi:hypothetical protein
MANGNTPGDGKTSPFTQGGGQVPGNNFITNPRGSNTGAGSRRFDNQQAPPQKPREATADIDEATAAPGGRVPLADAQDAPGKDIGVGSIGNSAKPFTLGGGGDA